MTANPPAPPILTIKPKAQVEKEKGKKKAKEEKEKAEKAARAKAKKEGRKYVKEEDNKPQEPLFPLTESAEKPTQPHTVRLHFAELDGLDTGDRIFHIFLQGERVLEDFDVVADAGGQDRGIVKEFSGVPVADTLHVFLQPANDETAAPILAGIEIIAETP